MGKAFQVFAQASAKEQETNNGQGSAQMFGGSAQQQPKRKRADIFPEADSDEDSESKAQAIKFIGALARSANKKHG